MKLTVGFKLFVLAAASVASLTAREPVKVNATVRNQELFAGIREGSLAQISAALDRGASPNSIGPDGTPALVEAILFCDAEAVRVLLAHGADPNFRGQKDSTPLIIASGDFAKVKALVTGGADVNARTAAGNTALLAAAPQRDSFRVVSLLLEKGAKPDAVDQTPDFLTRGQGNTALMAAARSQDVRTLQLLLDRSLDPNAANSTGGTALVNAISAHNLPAFRLLLQHGAKADFHFGPLQLTPLMWAAFQDEPGMVSQLIKAGADVNAKDALQASALVWAAMSERDQAETVAALLAAGAKPDVKTAQGETPLSWASRRGATEIARLLGGPVVVKEQDAPTPSMPLVSLEKQQAQVREAVAKGVAALLPSGPAFAKQSGCTSCHNNTVPLMAASVARSRAVPVNAALEQQNLKAVIGTTQGVRDLLVDSNFATPDPAVVLANVLMALHAQNVPASDLTAAAVQAIAAQQQPDGHWPSYINRAPMENGDIQATALSVRAIQLYGMPGRNAEWKNRVMQAQNWLSSAVAKTTEDRVMLVCGLFWSGAPADEVDHAASRLIAEQRSDGGWAQLPTLESDAYATGTALVALHEAVGLPESSQAYRLGVDFLLRSQEADGTWKVKTRAFPFQPLKDSGFPHGRDQWISAAGTSWAAMALAYSIEDPQSTWLPAISDQNDVVGAQAPRVKKVAVAGPVE